MAVKKNSFVIIMTLFAIVNLVQAKTMVLAWGHSMVWMGRNTTGLVGTEVHLTFKDNLPWGTRIFVHFGESIIKSSESSTWNNIQEKELDAISPYTWKSSIYSREIYGDSWRTKLRYDAIDFVIRVVLPSGDEYFEQGCNNFYRIYIGELPVNPVFIGCSTDDVPFINLPIEQM